MKALTFLDTRRVGFETVPDPVLVEPTDAIVRVRLSAVCGSDLHVYRGHEAGLDPGTVLGHEFLGEVVEVGDAVSRVAVGGTVVSPFTTSCGECAPCREGLTCRCTRGQLFGWVENGHGLQGAQAEYVRVPLADATLLALPGPEAGGPGGNGDPEAVLFVGDVLSTGFFCAESGGVRPGARVVVLGCGPVGLMAVVAARELGAERVLAVDGVPERLALARAFGASVVDFTATDPREAVLEATDGRGADVVLEAVGSAAASRSAYELVRTGGTISAVGVHTEPTFAFSPGEVYDKNLTYRAGRCPARAYMDRLLELVRAAKYDLSSIVSHRLPLSEGPGAYETFDRHADACTKVVLRP